MAAWSEIAPGQRRAGRAKRLGKREQTDEAGCCAAGAAKCAATQRDSAADEDIGGDKGISDAKAEYDLPPELLPVRKQKAKDNACRTVSIFRRTCLVQRRAYQGRRVATVQGQLSARVPNIDD